jgi:RNA 3'-terminal phosphate cyclase
MLMPCLLFQKEEQCKLTIKGGTLVGMSPTSHSFQYVLMPILTLMGVEATYNVKYHGLFPDIIGELNLIIKSLKSPLKPIDLTSRGKLIGIEIHSSYVSGSLELYY